MKFKVGDRVKFIDDSDIISDIFLFGEYGVIKTFEGSFIGVEFDNEFDDCHTLVKRSKDKHGWWCQEYQLILVDSKSCEETKVCFETYNKYICIHILLKNGIVIKDMFEVNKKESSDRVFKNIIEAIKSEEDEKSYITTPNNLVVDVEDISAIKIVEGENKHIASKDVFEVIK